MAEKKPVKLGRKKIFKGQNKFINLQLSLVQFKQLAKKQKSRKVKSMQVFLRDLIFNNPIMINNKKEELF